MSTPFYRLSVDIEAASISEAWDIVGNLPVDFSPGQIESGKFDHLKRFELVEVARQIEAVANRG